MSVISSVVMPVVMIRGCAYLLLNTVQSPLSLDFFSSYPDLSFLGEDFIMIMQATKVDSVRLHACIMYPNAVKKGDLITRFSTEEIIYSIYASATKNRAVKEAIKIIKGFGESFKSSPQKIELLARGLTVLSKLVGKV